MNSKFLSLLLAVLALGAAACESDAAAARPDPVVPTADVAPLDPAPITTDRVDVAVPLPPAAPPPPPVRAPVTPPTVQPARVPPPPPPPPPASVPAPRPRAATQQPLNGGAGVAGLVDRVSPLP